MTKFTDHQRDILIRRVSRALLWSQVSSSVTEAYRAAACERMARSVVNELQVSGFSAASQRRAIEKVVENLERPEPLAVPA